MAVALRDAYGAALAKYAPQNEKVYVLDADLANSSRSVLFQQACPNRFFDVGIAEANMAAMAGGIASCGMTPFIHTFATFMSSMCYLAAKSLLAYSGYNVRLMGVNNGVTGGYDGASHHALDDLAVMRGIPGMLVMTPSDEVMMDWMVRHLVEEQTGPTYVSISRETGGELYGEGEQFQIGKAKVLREGSDLTIIACGLSVWRAMQAAGQLAEQGISARVVDMFTIKPLDKAQVLESAALTGAIVTVEEHSTVGGLGTAVMEALCEAQIPVPVQKLGIQDTFTESGKYADLLQSFGMDTGSIVKAATEIVRLK